MLVYIGVHCSACGEFIQIEAREVGEFDPVPCISVSGEELTCERNHKREYQDSAVVHSLTPDGKTPIGQTPY